MVSRDPPAGYLKREFTQLNELIKLRVGQNLPCECVIGGSVMRGREGVIGGRGCEYVMGGRGCEYVMGGKGMSAMGEGVSDERKRGECVMEGGRST